MKGTILEFLTLAAEDPALARDLVELAKRYDFEFKDAATDAATDDELALVAGGAAGGDELKTLLSPFKSNLESLRALVAGMSSGTGGSQTTGDKPSSQGLSLPTDPGV